MLTAGACSVVSRLEEPAKKTVKIKTKVYSVSGMHNRLEVLVMQFADVRVEGREFLVVAASADISNLESAADCLIAFRRAGNRNH
jgi:vacuolar-type H+-ATPase subunit B/Vma2